MKNLLIIMVAILGSTGSSFAQITEGALKRELPMVYIAEDVSIHFISPEPIQYVDISTHHVAGDLPVKNVLRIKVVKDSLKKTDFGFLNRDVGIVTVVGEKYMAQYNVAYVSNIDHVNFQTSIHIDQNNMQPIDNSEVEFSEPELKAFATSILKRKKRVHSVSSKAYGLKAELNNIYTIGDYIFLDVSYSNYTNLKYDIDQVRFKIDDKKIVKATNVQSVEIKPVFTLYKNHSFKNTHKNIYVFKKFTFPGNKILNIETTEKQISGRYLNLQLDYSDLLNADTL